VEKLIPMANKTSKTRSKRLSKRQPIHVRRLKQATRKTGIALSAVDELTQPPWPWIGEAPTVIIGNLPALDNAKLLCTSGSVIQVVTQSQMTVQILIETEQLQGETR
jgi:hypothetical protein